MAYDQRPDTTEYADFYAGYIAHVPDGDIVAILATQLEDTRALLSGLDDQRALHAYATGKWSIKEVVGHVADAERVLAYRALRIARADTTPLAGYDENAWVPPARANSRPLLSLIEELAAVRGASVALFAGLPRDCWTRTGTANGVPVSVRALAWMIAGHELHHREIVAQRYLRAQDGDAAGTGAAAPG
jgi:hypothetical protein